MRDVPESARPAKEPEFIDWQEFCCSSACCERRISARTDSDRRLRRPRWEQRVAEEGAKHVACASLREAWVALEVRMCSGRRG